MEQNADEADGCIDDGCGNDVAVDDDVDDMGTTLFVVSSVLDQPFSRRLMFGARVSTSPVST